MKDALLFLVVLSAFIFGYFLMAQLDKFLNENRDAIEKEKEKEEPSCVMLTGNLSEDEIVKEVRRFRETHEDTRIILYDSTNTELPESMEHHTHRNQ